MEAGGDVVGVYPPRERDSQTAEPLNTSCVPAAEADMDAVDGTVGAVGFMKMCMKHMTFAATTLKKARCGGDEGVGAPPFVAKLDMLLERVHDIVLLLVMGPMYSSPTDMWWPVYEKMFLLLQLAESQVESTTDHEHRDVILDVYNTIAKLCSAMMSARLI